MYLIHQETLNVASNWIDLSWLVNWFVNYISDTDWKEVFGIDTPSAKDIVDNLFEDPYWEEDLQTDLNVYYDIPFEFFETMDNFVDQIREACEQFLLKRLEIGLKK